MSSDAQFKLVNDCEIAQDWQRLQAWVRTMRSKEEFFGLTPAEEELVERAEKLLEDHGWYP